MESSSPLHTTSCYILVSHSYICIQECILSVSFGMSSPVSGPPESVCYRLKCGIIRSITKLKATDELLDMALLEGQQSNKIWRNKIKRYIKQRGKKRFFTRFLLISCRFRSIPLAFRHSLKALFPCAPHCTVAEDVVTTLPGPCRLKTQAKTRKRFCLDCPHCNFAGKMKHSFLCRTRLRNWGAVNKKGDLK